MLRAKMASRPGTRCHAVPSRDRMAYRFPEPGPACLSDGYTEAQRGEATSPKPQSKHKAGPGETQRSRDASAAPPHRFPVMAGGGSQMDALWKAL